MSSESDSVVFEHAVEPQDNTVLFQSKKWAFITDNSSSGGQFSGQVQFNLNTLSNLNQWNHLAEAIQNTPYRIYGYADRTLTTGAVVDPLVATIKNGSHQFIDSVQKTIGGTTIQNAQIFENVNTTYKILSEWSLDEYRKWGPSLGISFDDWQLAVDGSATSYAGLANTGVSTVIPAYKGFTIPAGANPGLKERCLHLNNYDVSTSTANSILVNPAALGKSKLHINTSATLAAGTNAFSIVGILSHRLKDNSDVIAKMPPCKNLRGMSYTNYNSGTYEITVDTSGAIVSVNSKLSYGHTMPLQIGSFVPGYSTVGNTKWTIVCEIDGRGADGNVPAHMNARLYVPYYVANPSVDRALSMKKTIRYMERFVNVYTVDAQQSDTRVITPGVVNPKRLVLLPMLTGSGAGTAGLTALAASPETSPWGHEPSGSSPFAAINGFQVIVGGVPMFQMPLDMDYQTFMEEFATQGNNGGQEVQEASGLLDQRKWDQLYRFYTCDISRRMESGDGESKSVSVQLTNATKAPMKIIAFIWYEREIEVDTTLGLITQGV